MGLEASCAAKLGGAESFGKALLETSELVFRGDFRVRVPFRELTAVEVAGERLVLRFAGKALALALGSAAAERWADKIRNPPGRLDKLGVKPTSRVAAVGDPPADFLDELGARAAQVVRGAPRGTVDLVFLFLAADGRADLARLDSLRGRIVPDGGIWIVRPKGQPAPGAIGERDVRAAGRAAGLVDVKVAAFSATHTADKFVIPVRTEPSKGSAPPALRSARRSRAALEPTTPATATARSPRPRRSRRPPR